MEKGEIKGIQIEENSQICLEMFADDTNALVANEEPYLSQFWDCLHVYCKASGSAINHHKTGIICKGKEPPNWLMETGCNFHQQGEIFRLLGIPMGLNISTKD